jgi:hypothetical protein
MAISTVSSLTESFTSGVLLSGEDISLTKDKTSNGSGSERTVNAGAVQGTSQSKTTRTRGTDGQADDESEESDFEGVLEVHD